VRARARRPQTKNQNRHVRHRQLQHRRLRRIRLASYQYNINQILNQDPASRRTVRAC
jgi:hypothetical protein